jgi:prepilin-type N-terminal cleavage/methylation domain-containing protein
MGTKTMRKSDGFTLIEIAVVMGVLSIVLMVAAAMLTGTMETYATVARETETVKTARHCLEVMSTDVRESVNFDIQNPADAGPLAIVEDGLLLMSSRGSDGSFGTNPDNTADPQSIVLYYINLSAEGISQLMRHQLYYTEDLIAFMGPFTLAGVPTPTQISIVDSFGTVIPIDKTTGGSGAAMPFRAPRVMLNGATSLDLVEVPPPTPSRPPIVEARVTCQFTNTQGRVTTTRLSTTIMPRNL